MVLNIPRYFFIHHSLIYVLNQLFFSENDGDFIFEIFLQPYRMNSNLGLKDFFIAEMIPIPLKLTMV